MRADQTEILEFGSFRLDPTRHVLWFGSEPVQLAQKEIEILAVLVARAGEVVTKSEILDLIWEDCYVNESNISRHVYLIRKVFRELGESPELIQTVPRRGYRFTGKVQKDVVAESSGRAESQPFHVEPTGRFRGRAASFGRSTSFSAALLVVLILAGVVGWQASGSSAAPRIKSVAVLPLRSTVEADRDSRFGIGVADVVITRLSKLKSAVVRPSSSIAKFENENYSSADAAKALQVDAVVEGTLHRNEGKTRVTLRLVSYSDEVIWSDEFEKSSREDTTLASEIALRVSRILDRSSSKDVANHSFSSDGTAIELYQKGRLEWQRRDRQSMVNAERFFREAIDRDPKFVDAYVGLADRIMMERDPAEAHSLIQSALELDPANGAAYATRGFIGMFHEWDWPTAEADFRKAIELNPNHGPAHHWYAILLEIQGRDDEALVEFEKALEIDPMSFNYLTDFALFQYYSGDLHAAEKTCRAALEISPDFVFAHDLLGEILFDDGRFEEAIRSKFMAHRAGTFTDATPKSVLDEFDRNVEVSLEDFRRNGIESYLKSASGTPDKGDPSWYYGYAKISARLGDREQALGFLEQAYKAKTRFSMPFLNREPAFKSIRHDPRFIELVQKMRLAD